MAQSEGGSGACPECGTKHAAVRGNCEPLSKRRGPTVYLMDGSPNPKHPANNGAFDRFISSIRTGPCVNG
jgi:hypothetical protein